MKRRVREIKVIGRNGQRNTIRVGSIYRYNGKTVWVASIQVNSETGEVIAEIYTGLAENTTFADARDLEPI